MSKRGCNKGAVTMKILRSTAALLLLFFLAAISGACTKVPAKDSGSEWRIVPTANSKITLRFISSWGGVDSKAETLKQVLSEFENKNPGITIVNESLFGEDFCQDQDRLRQGTTRCIRCGRSEEEKLVMAESRTDRSA